MLEGGDLGRTELLGESGGLVWSEGQQARPGPRSTSLVALIIPNISLLPKSPLPLNPKTQNDSLVSIFFSVITTSLYSSSSCWRHAPGASRVGPEALFSNTNPSWRFRETW